MASQTIKNTGSTLRGSIGAGMSSLFNPNGRKYYILEHKVTSKYHRQGESQEIIVDTIEIGRDSRCQVRFDDNFSTVSRRHAAIIKDGDGWKLVQLSKTNTTFLNGRPIKSEWYLQNGDEIQLSVNGPKLGFIIPTGSKATVGSIGMTRRLSLFRQQALRPYKTAISCLSVLLLLAIVASGYFTWKNHNLIKANEELLTRMEQQGIKNDSIREEQRKQDSIEISKNVSSIKVIQGRFSQDLSALTGVSGFVAKAKPYVYAVFTTIHVEYMGKKITQNGGQGTGFLLSDGRFVTARHCVEPWMYDLGDLAQVYAMSKGSSEIDMYATIDAYSMDGDHIRLTNRQFAIDRSHDISANTTTDDNVEITLSLAMPVLLEDGTTKGSQSMLGSDWAYARVSGKKGGLEANASLSANLKSAKEVHVLGFPAGLGIKDGSKMVEPIYNKMSVASDNLKNDRCILVSEGVAHGNSGGPVFTVANGKFYVVGIVSRKESSTQQYGTFGIKQQQQQYDHIVPLSNLQN